MTDLDRLEKKAQREQVITAFLRSMGCRFELEVDGFLGCLTFGLILMVGSLAFSLSRIVCPAVPLVVLAASIFFAERVHRARRRQAHKRFFREVFMPEAKACGVEMAEVLARLRAGPHGAQQFTPGLANLANALPLLLDVLREEGHVVPEDIN